MGKYLNTKSCYTLYKSEACGEYFVDKTRMLKEIIPLVERGCQYICVTRPRRFGKTVIANMLGAFFGRGADSGELFGRLSVAECTSYERNRNKHNVIFISMNETPKNCSGYRQYIDRIQSRLIKELRMEYPDCEIGEEDALWDILDSISEAAGSRFLFILDEWDFIFHRDFVTEREKNEYLTFLRNLLKDKAYVSLAYMTGILPIAKYASGSELNMFLEYTMAGEERFSSYFGFTEAEVDSLYEKYLHVRKDAKVTREGLKEWYDGYHTRAGERVYNPRSVVAALTNNNLGSYWTSSGPYDEIMYYVEKNVADVRDSLALMVSGFPVPARIQEYAVTSMALRTRDEIFSAMVVYGFLSYENGAVSIPNKELMGKFEDMLRRQTSLGYVHRLAKESERMLAATKNMDVETMAEILAYAHDTEVPLLNYNNETELAAVVNLVYLSARDFYRIEREDKAGIGYADFIFYPEDKTADCIILELKVDHTPQEAIQQIKERRYALRFKGRAGEKPPYTGRILAVGIAYDRKTKRHQCKIEEL